MFIAFFIPGCLGALQLPKSIVGERHIYFSESGESGENAGMEDNPAWLQRFEALRQNSTPSWGHHSLKTRVLRSLQLDAEKLDEELLNVLSDKLASALSLVKGPSSHNEELGALLRFLVFYCTVWKCNPTPGQSLLNLVYTNDHGTILDSGHTNGAGCQAPSRLTKLQQALLGVGSILVPYTWSKLSSSGLTQSRSRICHHLFWCSRFLVGGWYLASLLNLLVFLKEGKYRNLLERLIGVHCVYRNPIMNRMISWEVLNRQLIWHEVSELLLSALPLLSVASTRSMFPLLRQFFEWDDQSSEHNGTGQLDSPVQHDSSKSIICPECGSSDIIMPYRALPCGHIYCYYCLRALGERGKVACESCGDHVSSMQPWNPRPAH